jgi:hypothetical protein
MATPFPFVSGAILTAGQLNSLFEAGTAFTPTLTGMTIGNGSQTHTYQQVNKLIVVHGFITLGSTSTVTADIEITLPVTGKNYGATTPVGITYMFDNSSGVTFSGLVLMPNGSTSSVTLVTQQITSSYLARGAISSTIPMTWAVSDQIRYQYTVEVA